MNFEKISVFLNIYKEISEKKFIEQDIFSIGNLALFVDYYYERNNWNKIYLSLKRFVKQENKNNFNIIIANGLYQISQECDIGDCIEYKMKRINNDYSNNKLSDFDLILDDYDFPKWFKDSICYFNNYDFKDVKQRLCSKINEFACEKINECTLNYLVEKLIEDKKVFEYGFLINACANDNNMNDLCYVITKFLGTKYRKDLSIALKNSYRDNSTLEKKKNYVTNTIEFHKNLYNNKRLSYLNYFTNEQHEELNDLLKA